REVAQVVEPRPLPAHRVDRIEMPDLDLEELAIERRVVALDQERGGLGIERDLLLELSRGVRGQRERLVAHEQLAPGAGHGLLELILERQPELQALAPDDEPVPLIRRAREPALLLVRNEEPVARIEDAGIHPLTLEPGVAGVVPDRGMIAKPVSLRDLRQ